MNFLVIVHLLGLSFSSMIATYGKLLGHILACAAVLARLSVVDRDVLDATT